MPDEQHQPGIRSFRPSQKDWTGSRAPSGDGDQGPGNLFVIFVTSRSRDVAWQRKDDVTSIAAKLLTLPRQRRQYCAATPVPPEDSDEHETRCRGIAAIVLVGMSAVVSAQKADPDAQKLADQYTAAFNKGDAKALIALYAAAATRLGPDGQLLTGRAAIEKNYADGFAGALKGTKLTLEPGQRTWSRRT